jgi:hypothetical protein
VSFLRRACACVSTPHGLTCTLSHKCPSSAEHVRVCQPHMGSHAPFLISVYVNLPTQSMSMCLNLTWAHTSYFSSGSPTLGHYAVVSTLYWLPFERGLNLQRHVPCHMGPCVSFSRSVLPPAEHYGGQEGQSSHENKHIGSRVVMGAG